MYGARKQMFPPCESASLVHGRTINNRDRSIHFKISAVIFFLFFFSLFSSKEKRNFDSEKFLLIKWKFDFVVYENSNNPIIEKKK